MALTNVSLFLSSKNSSIKGTRYKVSTNRRYLTDDKGEPFFYLGDTAWTLVKRLPRPDIDVYLKNRKAKGFTVIQAYLLRGLRVRNLYGELTLTDNDPRKPNEKFFENVDYVVNRANEIGLVMGFVACWGEHVRGVRLDEQIFDTGNAFDYGAFLANRYKDDAVMWFLGGDRMYKDAKEIWISMARGLKKGSDDKHLVSFHGPGNWDNPSSSFWFHNEDWLDFNTIQSGHGWGVLNFDFVVHDYELKPPKPTLDMEPRYENFPDVRKGTRRRMDAHQEREAIYWGMLAGAAGAGYGCNDIWSFYDPEVTPFLDDYAYPARFQTTHWRDAMDFQGAFCVSYARRLFELRPWYKMVPDQSLIVAGQGQGEDHISAARATDRSFAIVYSTYGSPVAIDLRNISGKIVRAHWYDPRNGTWHPIREFLDATVVEFTPPTHGETNDWVLVLDDTEKDYPLEVTRII
jgi:hypothetical protein